jgi:hypothetical protein
VSLLHVVSKHLLETFLHELIQFSAHFNSEELRGLRIPQPSIEHWFICLFQVVTSAHFQVGTCILHKLDGGATWWGGVIEKIEDGYLYVVRTTADGLSTESRRFLPDSDELAPLCHFPPDADVVLSKGMSSLIVQCIADL